MGLLGWLRRKRAPSREPDDAEQDDPTQQSTLDADEDWSWLHTPANPLEVSGWDRYWMEREKRNWQDPGLSFIMIPPIAVFAQRNGLRTVLCVGNGILMEPLVLAAAGLHVRAMDVSQVATTWAVRLSREQPTAEELVPKEVFRPGGQVEFVTGDLFGPAAVPGPFDVVIESRTLQLLDVEDRERGLDRLLERLAANGLFVSAAHDGSWRPPAPYPTQPLKESLRARGLRIEGVPRNELPLPGRQAWLQMTTG